MRLTVEVLSCQRIPAAQHSRDIVDLYVLVEVPRHTVLFTLCPCSS